MTDDRGLVAKLAGGGALLFAGSMFQAALTFVTRAYLARSLGDTLYGVVTAGISAVALVSTLGLLGIHRGVGRYAPRLDDDSVRGVILSGVAVVAPTLAVITLVAVARPEVIASTLFGSAALAPVALVFAVGLPFAATAEFAVGVAQGRMVSTPKAVVQNLVRPIVMGAGVVTAVGLGAGIVGVTMGYVAGYVAAGVVGLYYVFRLTPSGSGPIDWRRRELLVFSVPLIAVTAIRIFFLDLDVLMLSLLAETRDVGVYGGVFPLVKMFGIFLASFSFIAMPVFSRLHETGELDRMRSLYRTVAKWTFLCTLPLVLVLVTFPRPVIELTFGPEYRSGAGALRVLAAAYFVHAAVGPNSNAVISVGDTRTLALDNLVAAAVNIVLNLLLIPSFQFEGAAVGTAVGFVLMNGLVSVHLYRETGIHPVSRSMARSGVSGLLFGGTICLIAKGLFGGTLALFVVVVAFGLAYPPLVVYTGGFGEDEYYLLAQLEDRIGVDLVDVLDRR
jgi:O-antigen/teichoic acid export membrane protein